MDTSSRGVKDLDPPLAVVHHHDPSCLGTQRQPCGVDQGPPAAEGVGTHLLRTSGLLFIIQIFLVKTRFYPSFPAAVSHWRCCVLGLPRQETWSQGSRCLPDWEYTDAQGNLKPKGMRQGRILL
uniref:Uncharacterized protein n=1 Tax=Sus scrofa TaxID=9823 RepID=A0A4X1VNV1_PIG